MKREIVIGSIALAFCSHAVAQTSSVTMYGVIDGFLEYTNTGTHTTARMGSSGLYGSRWGLKGIENLGGGLKAGFVLEQGFNISNGTAADPARQFNRQAYVSLSKDNVGELRFGRQTSPMFFSEGQLDAFLGASIASGLNNLSDYTVRTDNTVAYISPAIAGVSTELYYGFGTTGNGLTGANASYQAALRYIRNRVYLTAVYQAVKNATNTDTLRSTYFGGHYDFDHVTAYLAFHTAKLGSANIERQVVSTSVRWNFSPVASVSLGYTYQHDRSGRGNNAQQVGLLTQYFLSKATQLYAAAAFLDNRKAATNTLMGAATAGIPLDYSGANARGVQFGITHFF
ncbi:porin [Pandoraea terrigena]|uniref:Outer membrane porin protein 32 n=1 Tax=Pandoraea terrigena TaxID=2508292 RepID=A0A5E4WKY9_9BURK|nr:porin [Pandoraea terrigena]VVE25348.1 Outer membrane porin protein 32 [Pandoraea terrigena]